MCIPSNEQAFQKSWEKLTGYFEHWDAWLQWIIFCSLLDQGRGHFVFIGSKWQRSWSPKQAGCDNCTMDEFSLGWTLETGNWPRFFVYCYFNYQIFPAPRIPGPKFYLESAQTYFEDVMIIILCVFSSAHLAPDRRNGLKRGRSRSQTPAQLCWARMFRYLGHDTNKHSGVGFKRLRLSVLNYPCKGGYNATGPIGYCCPPGAAALCHWGTPRQTCPQTPCTSNPVPFLVDPHLLMKV